MKLRHVIASLIAFAACANSAHADAKAKLEYFCKPENTPPYWTTQCDGSVSAHRVTVSITPDGDDAGRPGSYYIGLRSNGNIKRLFSGGQWVGTNGGLFPAAATTQNMGSSPAAFVVVNDVMICAMAGTGSLELWAGYGVLDREKEAMVEHYHRVTNPNHTPEYMRQVYIQNDMTRGKKGWNVLQFECQPDLSNTY